MKKIKLEPVIDYSDVMDIEDDDDEKLMDEENRNALFSVSLAKNFDCNITRADYRTAEVVNAYNLVCLFVAVDLFVEHHEPFTSNELWFIQPEK